MELTLNDNFLPIENDDLELVNGGIGVVAGGLIVCGVIFVAGVVTGLCDAAGNK